MMTDSKTSAGSRWPKLLAQLALSVPELAIAYGFGFAVFWGVLALGCRAVSPVCDSAGGLAVVIVALGVSIVAGGTYWVAALSLGLAGRRRARYVLDGAAAAVAVTTFATLAWREHSTQTAHRVAAETAALNEAAAREAWITALRQNPDGHGPPGVVPPMLAVVDDGRGVQVTNTSQEWLVVALARVLQDEQDVWRACPLLTVGEVSDYYRFSIGPGQMARYAPLPDCAAGFEGAPLEYRVGDPVLDATGWWSDTAFEVPNGRLR
jgi:hypothetical protein